MTINEWTKLAADGAVVLTLLFAIWQARNLAREHAWREFLRHFAQINNFIGTNHESVKPPQPTLKSDQTTAMLLYHHLNLIFRYYLNRRLMSSEERRGFERWMERVFYQWIRENPGLKEDLQTIVKGGDLYPEGFLLWIRKGCPFV
jgi:hypothetical protein